MRRALAAGVLAVLASPANAAGCPACAAAGVGGDAATMRAIAVFLALPFVLAALLALAARAPRR